MSNQATARKLAQGMRTIAALGGGTPESRLEEYLVVHLAGYPAAQRLELLEALAQELGMGGGGAEVPRGELRPAAAATPAPGQTEVHRLLSRFLGEAGNARGLSAEELAEKFGASLDTLFDSLNQIVSVINVNLLGECSELETIRKVIGSNIKGEAGYLSIREYLERIQQAFLVAHQSFQLAGALLQEELLRELDPQLLQQKGSGLKFGPLRKAELFDQYEEKYGRCRRWFDSGKYRERLLREFEKQCQLQLNGSAR